MTSQTKFPATLLAVLHLSLLLVGTLAVEYTPDTGAAVDQCEYKFTVRAPVDCSITDSELKETVRKLKQDIDMTRISAVSLNSAIQNQISNLQDGVDQLGAEINELRSSQNAIALTPDANRDNELTKINDAITELEERLSSLLDNVESQVMYMQKYAATLNSTIVSEKVERFRIESNLQAQVNQLLESLAKFNERVESLEKSVPDA